MKATREQRQKLYGVRWRRIRSVFLQQHPLCVMCTEDGRTRPATEVDHIVKHDGDPVLFYDVGNLQGLCADHHRGTKQKYEATGQQVGHDAQGNPLFPSDNWKGGAKGGG